MTFVPPSEPVAPDRVPGNIDPQNLDHPGFTDQEWAAIQANLDSHYNALYGSDPAPPTGQAGTEPVVDLGNQPPAVPVVPTPAATPPTEYDLGAVKVPVEDAPSLGALYALIRNDPDKGQLILDIVRGTQQPTPQPPPIWQQQSAPTSTSPIAPSVQIVPPEVIDSADPVTRLLFERMKTMEENQSRLLQLQQQQQAAEAERNRQAQLTARINRDTQLGLARFRQAHPDITDEQLNTLNAHVQSLGIVGALTAQLPGDQAVARAFELARLDLGSSLTGAPATPTLPADAKRQASLTALAGGSAGSVPRQEPPAPVDTAPDPYLTRAKAAAVEMLKQSGINLADHL
jgi:hypothetical protein